ncbi:MAG TPA: adenylosuccinate lyase [Spirochaetaceae bacterium]|nr:adenylosuccinate lyase [Spirochaetaceae bacterium]
MTDYEGYLSPFSWRYGTADMRRIWSEVHKRELWRSIWVSLAKVESDYGLTDAEQVAELKAHAGDIDMERSLAIEAEIRHDLMAEIKAFAEQCPKAGGIIHLGATSMDIEDNADALRIRESLVLIRSGLAELLKSMSGAIRRYSRLPVMAFTHLQPAEPTTFGYRCAVWAQDLLTAFDDIAGLQASIRGKGFKGAVGTSASYGELVGVENLSSFEGALEKELGIAFYPVTTQTCSRLQEYKLLSTLSELGAALHKMAFDLRVLQSPPIGEVSEPFAKKQVGSSAMPFKRNPIDAEKIDSLARLLSSYPQVAWSNASLSLLERTLDDSANRRTILPEAFLICDELIKTARKIVDGFLLDEAAIRRTYLRYAPFACTERVLMAMAKRGADRQETHERLRRLALAAWADIKEGKENPLAGTIAADDFFRAQMGEAELAALMNIDKYLGDSVERAERFAGTIEDRIAVRAG